MISNKITKADLLEEVYKNSDYEKCIVQDVFEKIIEQIKLSLEKGDTIELRGFGTFEPRLRSAKNNARNPKTGKTLYVAPHYVVAFRAGQDLKNAVWNLPVIDESDQQSNGE